MRTPYRPLSLTQVSRSRLLALAFLVFYCALGAPAAAQRMAWWEQPANSASLTYTPGQRVRFHFERTADWEVGDGQRGFAGVVTILSEESGTLVIDQVGFDLGAHITTAWNAGVGRDEEGRYVARPAIWNSTLEPGQARSFGFTGTYEGAFAQPSNFGMAGRVTVAQPAPPPIAPDCPLATAVTVKATWSAENGGHGFLAEVYVTNVGPQPSSWLVALDTPARVDAASNAAYLRLLADEDRYLFAPEAWNAVIEPGSTVSFGITGGHASQDVSAAVIACPDLQLDDPYRATYVREWLALSAERRRDVAAGRLVWNGSNFLVPPPDPRPPGSR